MNFANGFWSLLIRRCHYGQKTKSCAGRHQVQDHNAQQARRSLDEDDTDAPCIAETWSNYHFAQFKTVHPPIPARMFEKNRPALAKFDISPEQFPSKKYT